MSMKLTATQKHELKLTRLGGDGMYVSTKHAALRTFEALARRGLVEHKPGEDGIHLKFYAITDAGRAVADKLIASPPVSADAADA